MQFVYDIALKKFLDQEIDLKDGTVKVCLCATNTTADTERDKTTLGGFTTLDRFDGLENGGSYSDKTLSNKTLTIDATNHRCVFDADDATWTALAAGTRSIAGVLLYFTDGMMNDVPIAWFDYAAPRTPSGGVDFVVQWHADGILRLST